MNTFVREPGNTFTHLIGILLSFVALVAMLIRVTLSIPSPLAITSIVIFGTSLIALYSASTIYHMIIANDKIIYVFRKIDHSMIFFLIAGTYTPICLITLGGVYGWSLLGVIYTLSISGMVFKIFWFNCPRWLSTGIYIAVGWLVVMFFPLLAAKVDVTGLVVLILGGVAYTVGGVIYGLKPRWMECKYFGHHEVFHIFVLLGSAFHFIFVFFYVI